MEREGGRERERERERERGKAPTPALSWGSSSAAAAGRAPPSALTSPLTQMSGSACRTGAVLPPGFVGGSGTQLLRYAPPAAGSAALVFEYGCTAPQCTRSPPQSESEPPQAPGRPAAWARERYGAGRGRALDGWIGGRGQGAGGLGGLSESGLRYAARWVLGRMWRAGHGESGWSGVTDGVGSIPAIPQCRMSASIEKVLSYFVWRVATV
jgi:hypothetical protein